MTKGYFIKESTGLFLCFFQQPACLPACRGRKGSAKPEKKLNMAWQISTKSMDVNQLFRFEKWLIKIF